MVVIVEIGSSVEWEPAVDTPGKIVSAVTFYSLEAAEQKVNPQGQEVRSKYHRPKYGCETEEDDLQRVGVFGCDAERCRVFVMYVVDVSIQKRGMKRAMTPVEDEILAYKAEKDLPNDFKYWRQWQFNP